MDVPAAVVVFPKYFSTNAPSTKSDLNPVKPPVTHVSKYKLTPSVSKCSGLSHDAMELNTTMSGDGIDFFVVSIFLNYW